MNDEILNRFNKILGQEATSVDINQLSSAQRARFISWMREKNFDLSDTSIVLKPEVSQSGDNLSSHLNSSVDLTAVGIDIQFIPELFPQEPDDLKSDPQISGIFTFREISFSETKRQPIETLAGIFAAKEAIIKTGFVSTNINDLRAIEILHRADGKPEFPGYLLSISHSHHYAIAIAQKNIVATAVASSETHNVTNESHDVSGTPGLSHFEQRRGFSKTTVLVLILIAIIVSYNLDLIIDLIRF